MRLGPFRISTVFISAPGKSSGFSRECAAGAARRRTAAAAWAAEHRAARNELLRLKHSSAKGQVPKEDRVNSRNSSVLSPLRPTMPLRPTTPLRARAFGHCGGSMRSCAVSRTAALRWQSCGAQLAWAGVRMRASSSFRSQRRTSQRDTWACAFRSVPFTRVTCCASCMRARLSRRRQ